MSSTPLMIVWLGLTGGMRLPTVTIDKAPFVPLGRLACELGMRREALIDAAVAADLVCPAPVSVRENDAARARRDRVVPLRHLPGLLFFSRPRKGAAMLRRLRRQTEAIALKDWMTIAPPADVAVVRAAVLERELEIERLRVADRDRQIASLIATLNGRTASQVMNQKRMEKRNLMTTERWLQVAELARSGASTEAIAQRMGLNAYSVKYFLAGRYNSLAARAAMSDLKIQAIHPPLRGVRA